MIRVLLGAVCLVFAGIKVGAGIVPQVELEEEVYGYEPANNGAGPMWCHGSTCLVRVGDRVFASGLETLPDAKPLNNCRWTLYSRTEEGWKRIAADESGRTREPSPMAAFGDGRFFLSANPTLTTNRETYSGPARPEVLEFKAREPEVYQRLLPVWEGTPRFTEHSYRSLAADGVNGELILLQNIDYAHAEWSLLDREGKWTVQGKLRWPVENGKPIRLCYPNVAMRSRAVHFCGTSDIIEPNADWRAHKKQLTGQEWDYTFRRLFYSWTPNVASEGFRDWVEIANVDATAGGINLGDLWLAPDGRVHILWTERKIDERLREKFLPGEKQQIRLVHAVVADGRVIQRQTLLEANEGREWEVPGRGRFQVTAENRLFAVFYVSGQREGRAISENRVVELLPDGTATAAVVIPLKHPLGDFFTANVRAGSPPSQLLEMFGPRAGSRNTMSFARVRLQ